MDDSAAIAALLPRRSEETFNGDKSRFLIFL